MIPAIVGRSDSRIATVGEVALSNGIDDRRGVSDG